MQIISHGGFYGFEIPIQEIRQELIKLISCEFDYFVLD